MSSCPTGLTSTIVLSSSFRSPSDAGGPREPAAPPSDRVAVIACGALGHRLREVVANRRLEVDIHLLPPLLHNRPALMAGEVERLAVRLRSTNAAVAVAYADCGT